MSVAWTFSLIRYLFDAYEVAAVNGDEEMGERLTCMVEQQAAQGMVKGFLLAMYVRSILSQPEVKSTVLLYVCRLLACPSSDPISAIFLEEVYGSLEKQLTGGAGTVQTKVREALLTRVCEALSKRLTSSNFPTFTHFRRIAMCQSSMMEKQKVLDRYILSQVPSMSGVFKMWETPSFLSEIFYLTCIRTSLKEPYALFMEAYRTGGVVMTRLALYYLLSNCRVDSTFLLDEKEWLHLRNSLSDAISAHGIPNIDSRQMAETLIRQCMQGYAPALAQLKTWSDLPESELDLSVEVVQPDVQKTPESVSQYVGAGGEWSELLGSVLGGAIAKRKVTRVEKDKTYGGILLKDTLQNTLPLLTKEYPIVCNVLMHNYTQVTEVLPPQEGTGASEQIPLTVSQLLTFALSLPREMREEEAARECVGYIKCALVPSDIDADVQGVSTEALAGLSNADVDQMRNVFVCACVYFRTAYLHLRENKLFSLVADANLVKVGMEKLVSLWLSETSEVRRGALILTSVLVGCGAKSLDSCFGGMGSVHLLHFVSMLRDFELLYGDVEEGWARLILKRASFISKEYIGRASELSPDVVEQVRHEVCGCKGLPTRVLAMLVYNQAVVQSELEPLAGRLASRHTPPEQSLTSIYAHSSPYCIGRWVRSLSSLGREGGEGGEGDCVKAEGEKEGDKEKREAETVKKDWSKLLLCLLRGTILKYGDSVIESRSDVLVLLSKVGSWVELCLEKGNLPSHIAERKDDLCMHALREFSFGLMLDCWEKGGPEVLLECIGGLSEGDERVEEGSNKGREQNDRDSKRSSSRRRVTRYFVATSVLRCFGRIFGSDLFRQSGGLRGADRNKVKEHTDQLLASLTEYMARHASEVGRGGKGERDGASSSSNSSSSNSSSSNSSGVNVQVKTEGGGGGQGISTKPSSASPTSSTSTST
mmetsp:Transcript_18677/g.47194  ORF Transcript_18677/g.47194 Transcript_18677/m.47194 type:complete len:933 (-) Transcript_18677:2297-5095(-)